MMNLIKTSFEHGRYKVTLNRPEMRNALNREMRLQLAEALRCLPEGTRLVELRGAREAFCAGQDLSEFGENSDVRAIMFDEYKPIIDAIDASDVPVIAGVEGACAGAGVSLALAADIVIASEDAFFQIAFGKVGLVPDIGVTYLLPRLIGLARAQGMALSGEKVPARKAKDWGMIWQVLSDGSFENDFDAFCENLAQGPSYALGLTRKLMRNSFNSDFYSQFECEAEYQTNAAKSQDFFEGVNAFLEKRAPKFEGR